MWPASHCHQQVSHFDSLRPARSPPQLRVLGQDIVLELYESIIKATKPRNSILAPQTRKYNALRMVLRHFLLSSVIFMIGAPSI
ncbi:hypothetical protein J6590_012687 [Homalodisca vitripennis]|nr:hypothetical protein J6590_012687 [Homalodisca vitripennis]